MTRFRFFAAFLGFAVPVCTVATAFAQGPPALFGVSHISNESSAKATIYYRSGDGSWQRRVIERGRRLSIAHPLNGSSLSTPPLFVRIDSDTDGVKWVEYRLSRGPSPDDFSTQFGHHFRIRQIERTDARYIEALPGAFAGLTDADSQRPF